MRQWRVGTLTMGLLLIVLGVVLIISQVSGWSSIDQIFKWWPIVLIMLGLEILGYLFFSRNEQSRVKYDGFSIFIIIIIMIFSIGMYSVKIFLDNVPVTTYGSSISLSSLFNHYRYESNFDKKYTLDGKDKNKIVVNNKFGNIKIKKSSNTNIEVLAKVHIDNNNEVTAKNVADSLIDIGQNSSSININSNVENRINKGAVGNISIDYIINIPDDVSVQLYNKYGNISADNIKANVNAECSNSSVSLENIAGNISVTNKYGDVSLSNTSGTVSIKNSNGSIRYENDNDINNNVSINDEYGSIDLIIRESQKGNFKLSTEYGTISSNMKLNKNKDSNREYVNESIGNSNTQIAVQTKNGDINISTK